MRHLIICREYPPASYPPGGIGTYVGNMARLLAEAGEVVHVVAELWEGAPDPRQEHLGGKLVIHRVPVTPWGLRRRRKLQTEEERRAFALFDSVFPPQAFAWHAALVAERLVEEQGIDIVEAQEWEAPLYYFQLRRALGLGPARRPPCVIHFHSPTELIVRSNDFDPAARYVLSATRLERASIAAADAYLCPSRYLAAQAEEAYDLLDGAVEVIPYPIGDTPRLPRKPEVWETGTVCYVGRLEPRKGVVEWVREAVTVARELPEVRFDFVGADLPYTDLLSVQDVAASHIPRDLRDRFRFHGETDRRGVLRHLAAARIAAVPSRWENFPNACIEAMCTGLPVVASREGGMVEMVEDGSTGWLGSPLVPGSLAAALRRALAVQPRELERMGGAAAATIRELCDNGRTVERQLDFRARVADGAEGAGSRLPLPRQRPGTIPPAARPDAVPDRDPQEGVAAALLVDLLDSGEEPKAIESCLRSLLEQTARPPTVVVLARERELVERSEALASGREAGWKLLVRAETDPSAARSEAVREALAAHPGTPGVVFLDGSIRLRPQFLEKVTEVLRAHPEVGLVTAWRLEGGRMPVARIPAEFPYQWVWNDARPPVAVRAEALRLEEDLRSGLSRGFETWDLCNGVLASGYRAVVYPDILSEHERTWADSVPRSFRVPGYWRLRRLLLSRPASAEAEEPGIDWLDGALGAPERRGAVATATAGPAAPTGRATLATPRREQLLPHEAVELALLLESEVQRLVRERFITVPKQTWGVGYRFTHLPLRARLRYLWLAVTNPRQSAPMAKWALTNPRKALLRLFGFRAPSLGRRKESRRS